MMGVLLTDEEFHAHWLTIRDPFIPRYLDVGRSTAKAQVKKIAHWIENLPTDGMDKWFFYHKELAERLLKECE